MKAVKTVPEVITQMIQHLRDRGVGKYHVRDLETRLGRFGESFKGPIHEITESEIADWLLGLKKIIWIKGEKKHIRVELDKGASVSKRTRNNYRDAVGELFEFARRPGHLHGRAPNA